MAGTWWCQKCKEAVISQRVTFQECHDTCGHPVEWVEYQVTMQEELTQAKDLVRRMRMAILYHDATPVKTLYGLIAEAEAMTHTSSETVTSAAVTLGEAQEETHGTI